MSRQQIRSGLSNKDNKEIILQNIIDMDPVFKTYLRDQPIGASRWGYLRSNIFEELFYELQQDGVIVYTPYKPLKLNINLKLQVTPIKCPFDKKQLYDQTWGLGNKRIYQCGTCEAVYFSGQWWTKDQWQLHTDLYYKI